MPHHPQSPHLPLIPPLFTHKKASILSSLSLPSSSYTDLSPKGSIDASIRNLIDRINNLEGVVTTSSCAGRISVFLEGAKSSYDDAAAGYSGADGTGMGMARGGGSDDDDGDRRKAEERQSTVPGGKGKGGRWLFVSHDPVDIPAQQSAADTPFSRLFGLSPRAPKAAQSLPVAESRYVKFQFEPMILHIMTASLHHAQRILSAAINAGFRESGVQSLKNLDDANSFPMVAVRSSGLALSSLIGFASVDDDGEDVIESMVDEEHLELLLRLGNARFVANTERIRRFEEGLFGGRRCQELEWEDTKTRRERKRAEGLKEKERVQRQNAQREQSHEAEASEDSPLF